MTKGGLLEPRDLDVPITFPEGLVRLVEQEVANLAPWHIMPRDLAQKRMSGLRQRYATKYVPFARRQDNDDLACLDSSRPGMVVVIHDFADAGNEERKAFPAFWDWFRQAVEDMIEFE